MHPYLYPIRAYINGWNTESSDVFRKNGLQIKLFISSYLLAKIILFDLNLDLVFERIVKIIGLKLFNERIKYDLMKESKDEGVVHDQTWKSAIENSLVFIISQDQLAESCNITFSFYFGGNAWLMILTFYLSPGTFNIRGFIFQRIKSLVWGQYVVCNVIF